MKPKRKAVSHGLRDGKKKMVKSGFSDFSSLFFGCRSGFAENLGGDGTGKEQGAEDQDENRSRHTDTHLREEVRAETDGKEKLRDTKKDGTGSGKESVSGSPFLFETETEIGQGILHHQNQEGQEGDGQDKDENQEDQGADEVVDEFRPDIRCRKVVGHGGLEKETGVGGKAIAGFGVQDIVVRGHREKFHSDKSQDQDSKEGENSAEDALGQIGLQGIDDTPVDGIQDEGSHDEDGPDDDSGNGSPIEGVDDGNSGNRRLSGNVEHEQGIGSQIDKVGDDGNLGDACLFLLDKFDDGTDVKDENQKGGDENQGDADGSKKRTDEAIGHHLSRCIQTGIGITKEIVEIVVLGSWDFGTARTGSDFGDGSDEESEDEAEKKDDTAGDEGREIENPMDFRTLGGRRDFRRFGRNDGHGLLDYGILGNGVDGTRFWGFTSWENRLFDKGVSVGSTMDAELTIRGCEFPTVLADAHAIQAMSAFLAECRLRKVFSSTEQTLHVFPSF